MDLSRLDARRSNGPSSSPVARDRHATRLAGHESTSLWRGIPAHLAAGLILIAIFWPITWGSVPFFSQNAFFPLWLGYVLTMDGLVLRITGTSPLTRSRARWIWLFLFSAPVWWLFEGANRFLGNWEYILPHPISGFEYFIRSSIAFSTVIPAVFTTSELGLWLARRLRWNGHFIRIAPGQRGLLLISASGVSMLALSLLFPHWAFGLVWIGAFLALDPINRLLGARSVAADIARNEWRTVAALLIGGILCGFFWEMWNFYSMPKWVYHVSYVGHPKLFEMPVLGYGGYLPFALELFALYNLAFWLVMRKAEEYALPPQLEVRQPRSTDEGTVAGDGRSLL
jgi:hypothetical protein